MTVQIQHTTFGALLLFQSEREVNKNRKRVVLHWNCWSLKISRMLRWIENLFNRVNKRAVILPRPSM
jgi:hypothetical protein